MRGGQWGIPGLAVVFRREVLSLVFPGGDDEDLFHPPIVTVYGEGRTTR